MLLRFPQLVAQSSDEYLKSIKIFMLAMKLIGMQVRIKIMKQQRVENAQLSRHVQKV